MGKCKRDSALLSWNYCAPLMLSAALGKISFFGIPASVARISPKVILTLTFKKQKALDLGPITLVWGGSIGRKRKVFFFTRSLDEFLLFSEGIAKIYSKILELQNHATSVQYLRGSEPQSLRENHETSSLWNHATSSQGNHATSS